MADSLLVLVPNKEAHAALSILIKGRMNTSRASLPLHQQPRLKSGIAGLPASDTSNNTRSVSTKFLGTVKSNAYNTMMAALDRSRKLLLHDTVHLKDRVIDANSSASDVTSRLLVRYAQASEHQESS